MWLALLVCAAVPPERAMEKALREAAAVSCPKRPIYIDASTILSAEDKHAIFEANTRRVFPRLDALLKSRGH